MSVFGPKDDVVEGRFGNGSAANPSMAFLTNSGSGFFLDTGGSIGFSTNGTKRLRVADTGLGFETALTVPASSSTTTCALNFDGDANTGITRPAADQVGLCAGGTNRLVTSASGTTVAQLNATSVVSSGAVSGTTITGSGAVTGTSINGTSVVSSGPITGTAINATSVVSSGAISGTTITGSGAVTGTSINGTSVVSSGPISCTTLTASSTISGTSITGSGTFTGNRYVCSVGTRLPGAPMFTATGEIDTGVYFPSLAVLGLAAGGNASLLVHPTKIVSNGLVEATTLKLTGQFLRVDTSSGSQTWNGTTIVVLFNTSKQLIGTGFTYSSGTYTCTVAGTYQINASVRCSSGTGYLSVSIRTNISGIAGLANQLTNLTNPSGLISANVSGVASFAVGETFDVTAFHNNASDLTLSAATDSSRCSVVRLH